jgi:cysteinyl-tRNA synthetase
MEWDSPWGRGAPGWHLECSRDEPRAARLCRSTSTPAASITARSTTPTRSRRIRRSPAVVHWIARAFGRADVDAQQLPHRPTGKMSKSSGEFLRLQTLIDRGFHPLAYRMMCLQAHYRSELEFSWDNLAAALTRLKKMLLGISRNSGNRAVLKDLMDRFDNAISNDLGTPAALPIFEEAIWSDSLSTVKYMDQVMGLDLANLNRADLRIRPKSATLTEAEIEAALDKRAEAAPPRTSPRPTPSATTSSPRASR